MAEALLKSLCEQKSDAIIVASAGIAALVNHKADKCAISLMAERGVDIQAHQAQQLTHALIADYDLILVMERGHLEAINAMAPQSRGRVHLLGKWCENEEIADPYRQSEAHFKAALAAIDRGVNAWSKYL
jgi:protein-tyrosine phosphatase